MEISNTAALPEAEFVTLAAQLAGHKTLGDVLSWAAAGPRADFYPQTVLEVVTQDEFTHDVVVPYKNWYLVYDTT